MWWFAIPVHYETIATIKLINTPITSHGYLVCVCWEHLRSTLSRFQVYNTLTIVTILYIRSLQLTTKSLCFLTNLSPFLPLRPTGWVFWLLQDPGLVMKLGLNTVPSSLPTGNGTLVIHSRQWHHDQAMVSWVIMVKCQLKQMPWGTMWLLYLRVMAVKVTTRTVAWKGFFWVHRFAYKKKIKRSRL